MWYFAYGSNLNISAVAEWCRQHGHRTPNLRPGRRAILDNYRLCFPVFSEYWGGGTGDIVYDPGKYVAGALFELSEFEMKTMDLKVARKLWKDTLVSKRQDQPNSILQAQTEAKNADGLDGKAP